MPFDPDKDKMIKQWKCEETGLMISINQYGDAQPKAREISKSGPPPPAADAIHSNHFTDEKC